MHFREINPGRGGMRRARPRLVREDGEHRGGPKRLTVGWILPDEVTNGRGQPKQ